MSSLLRKKAFSALIPALKMPAKKISAATARSPVNIALIKYWGKRDNDLNLPVTDSISIALDKHTTTTVSQVDSCNRADIVISEGKTLSSESFFYKKVVEFISHARPNPDFYFKIETKNDVPTGSGLASSASGFCALAEALNLFFGWALPLEKISSLARLGSGSACRSVFPGIVRWKKGLLEDGSDSHAVALPYTFPEMRIGIELISKLEKPISSRDAMIQTISTSPLYASWPQTVEKHIEELLSIWQAPSIDFFHMFGLCEQNAMAMHATMAASRPAILYWIPETVRVLHKIFQFRNEERSIPLFYTMDAGPNIKLLFLQKDEGKIREYFPQIEIVSPLWSFQ
ncbi:MAG: diphosphomevalonate decarboxylase [Chlamydia sp.]